jgi:hypothetical protein
MTKNDHNHYLTASLVKGDKRPKSQRSTQSKIKGTNGRLTSRTTTRVGTRSEVTRVERTLEQPSNSTHNFSDPLSELSLGDVSFDWSAAPSSDFAVESVGYQPLHPTSLPS